VTGYWGPKTLQIRDEAAPLVGAGQLLVDVEAARVNYRDVYEREGSEGATPPFVAGIEGAGTVAALGSAATGFVVGDRVAWIAAQGSYATQVAVEAARAVFVPARVSSEVAAASLLQGITAHFLATSAHPVQPGETALVHAVAGGEGLLLAQVVKLRGGRVIGTTSSDEKAELARAVGVEDVIGYEDFGERVRELTRGEGVAVVYDGVGKSTFDESLGSLRRRGPIWCSTARRAGACRRSSRCGSRTAVR
jgi:NADPH2:quinone reductase